eukprot:TRINITY_DN19291_c0_g1_i1.p1 TRINITY_DN19291_c0_g1~~TRINITY_DN19291_c0_g1_i1.p1  ORF type:complete len:251 (+),score=64.76 TRINITY_DN19291_c0_g1_i1:85-753(+)
MGHAREGHPNAARVRRDAAILSRIERAAGAEPNRSFLAAEAAAALKAVQGAASQFLLPAELSGGGRIYSKEFPPERAPGGLPPEVGCVRVFALGPRAVLRGYELHANSTQRIRVVSGRGTWHVAAAAGSTVGDGPWEAPAEVPGTPLSASGDAAHLRHCHIVDRGTVHFVENRGSEATVCLTWHEARQVVDRFTAWSDPGAARIAGVHRRFDAERPPPAAKL